MQENHFGYYSFIQFHRDDMGKMALTVQIRHICKRFAYTLSISCKKASGIGGTFGVPSYATTDRKTGSRFRNCFQKSLNYFEGPVVEALTDAEEH